MYKKIFDHFTVLLNQYLDITGCAEDNSFFMYHSYKDGKDGERARRYKGEPPPVLSVSAANEALNKFCMSRPRQGFSYIIFTSRGIQICGASNFDQIYIVINHDINFIKELCEYENGIYKNHFIKFFSNYKDFLMRDYNNSQEMRDLMLLISFEKRK